VQYFRYNASFDLESGARLSELTIAYHCFGRLNASKSNVIWICHALTANSNAVQWWPGLVGEGYSIDPEKYFIVCANFIGSCYGSTGPLSNNPGNGKPYYSDFPMVTIRDMVKSHILLRKQLGIEMISLVMGGSMGGYQALEWAVMEPEVIRQVFLIATSATESPWGIAVHTSQRMAIEADASWREHSVTAGLQGLKAARAMGILTYRNYGILAQKQVDQDPEKIEGYRAASYVIYQGEKLATRFNAYSYWLLTKAMDSHHLARGRGGNLAKVLESIRQRTLIIGINSDILCPLVEQKLLADHIPNARLIEIDSAYGHDGFLVESEKISFHLDQWLMG
jgi:homoserine O-acetyltransferase/O-succinyltransferase